MKSKLLPILLILLLLLNGVLIFMLINKPHEKKQERPERHFLTEQLQFSDEQSIKFEELDASHRERMTEIDKKMDKHKEVLFNSFQEDQFNLDSLTAKIGLLDAKRESEVFNFFRKVRALCNNEQVKKFDILIKKALNGGDRRPPGEDRGHHPEHEGMPPPPR